MHSDLLFGRIWFNLALTGSSWFIKIKGSTISRQTLELGEVVDISPVVVGEQHLNSVFLWCDSSISSINLHGDFQLRQVVIPIAFFMGYE